MQPIIMQDWTTIRGAASTSAIQSQNEWILTAPFQDISFYLDVREVSGTGGVQVAFETCPSRDDVLFHAMGTVTVTTPGVTVTNILALNAQFPVAHWTRWKLIGPAFLWDLTFRIMASGNNIG